MARFVYKLPDIGEGIAEAEIVKWHAAAGEAIAENQPLVDIMTDKATVEVASPVSGLLVACSGNAGDRLAVGAELAVIETEAAEAADAEGAPLPQAREEPAAAPPEAPSGPPVPRPGKALAAPAVRARAAALGIDLAAVAGSGPEGRVLHADLDGVLRRHSAPAPGGSAVAGEDAVEDIPVFGLRRRIAERMLESKRSIPHFTYVEEIDVEALETLRAGLNAGEPPDGRLSVLPFLVRAMVEALRSHPGVNGHYDRALGVFRRHGAVHVGLAVETERGLLVPVLRHAERLALREIAAGIARLAAEARAGKSERAELHGSTITVTSLGRLGGVMATPIINPPEVAIIGVNRIAESLALENGQVRMRRKMNLSSSFDHRIVDGAAAAAFIAAVKAGLESPARLLERRASA